jgi:hypothetical protein
LKQVVFLSVVMTANPNQLRASPPEYNEGMSKEHRKLCVEPLEERRVLSAARAALGTPFVTALYQDVLNRAPDQTGLDYFSNLVASGTPPSEIVADFWQSAEHRGIEVDGFYQAILGRAADSAGLQYWVGRMVSGTTEETVEASLLGSNEYLQHNPPVQSFVDGLFQGVLDRSADSAGGSYWTNALEAGRETIPKAIQAFINSTERHTILVNSLYSDFLNRPPDPTSVDSWVQQLDLGLLDYQAVAETFLSSAEYIVDHPLT